MGKIAQELFVIRSKQVHLVQN